VGCPGGWAGDPAACTDWDVCMVIDGSAPNGECRSAAPIGAVRLRFTTAEDNVGDGPLLLYGRRDRSTDPRMRVRQAFQTTDQESIPDSYASAQRAIPAWKYYEPATMHQHWHTMGFAHFALRTPGGGTVVTDRKNGFCLGDRYTTADAHLLPNAPLDDTSAVASLARFLRGNMCNHHQPAALEVTGGISVGQGDDYRHTVDFQWLDITRVSSGLYDVINTVNADRTLLEKNYDNNTSSIAISIEWPGGAHSPPANITQAPVVTLLRSCPGRAQCIALKR
nr:lysyl oxidase family protein [Actinomycetota bacterium]